MCLHLWRNVGIPMYYSRALWRYHLIFGCTCHVGWAGCDQENNAVFISPNFGTVQFTWKRRIGCPDMTTARLSLLLAARIRPRLLEGQAPPTALPQHCRSITHRTTAHSHVTLYYTFPSPSLPSRSGNLQLVGFIAQCHSSAAQSARLGRTRSASSPNTYRMTRACKETAWSAGDQAGCTRVCADSRWAEAQMA